jgi:hypothetical protein
MMKGALGVTWEGQGWWIITSTSSSSRAAFPIGDLMLMRLTAEAGFTGTEAASIDRGLVAALFSYMAVAMKVRCTSQMKARIAGAASLWR